MHTSIYTRETPALLEQLANTPEMKRLSDVGMHCGCEYSGALLYRNAQYPYSRLMHSVGVAGIVWNFTNDVTQAVAGLLHDIATPVFSHTIDFMNNDHLTQESTEDKTLAFIESSKEITHLLKSYGICISDVCDYHRYPIADNDTPMLSADRLEYTLGNAHIIYNVPLCQIKEIYDDLSISINEHDAEELCFRSVKIAKAFTEIALRNSHFYVSDLDRFLMQYLAEIVRSALSAGVLTHEDLYTTESNVTGILNIHDDISILWYLYRQISSVASSNEELLDRYCLKVSGKKRYIDPLVITSDGARRISDIDVAAKTGIDDFLALDFDKWLYIV